jgi:hypothetical protein
MMTNQIVPGGFFCLLRHFNISEISLIVNSIKCSFESVLNSKLGGLQLLSSKEGEALRCKIDPTLY